MTMYIDFGHPGIGRNVARFLNENEIPNAVLEKWNVIFATSESDEVPSELEHQRIWLNLNDEDPTNWTGFIGDENNEPEEITFPADLSGGE